MTDRPDLIAPPPLPEARADIARMTAAAQRAVIAPAAPGRWPTGWRRAVAARICARHGADALAADYLAASADPEARALADPALPGRDGAERVVLAFLDKVASAPRDARAEDIATLKAAGVDEADIVRLCELAAFLAYQCQVAAGLALLAETRA